MTDFNDPTDWNFEKCPKKPKYNEGDKISTSANPLFTTGFSKIPIVPLHTPCGYWDYTQYQSPESPYYPPPPFIPFPRQFANSGGFINCEGVAEISYSGASVSELGGSDEGYAYITGGVGPFYWSIEGYGFFLGEGTDKYITTTERSVRVHTDGAACGMGRIYVHDACSSDKGGVRCTTGYWRTLALLGYGSFAGALDDAGAEEGGVTMGATGAGDYSRIDDTNEFWLGQTDITPGVVGTNFGYNNNVWGSPEDCLANLRFTDPVVGVFEIQLFQRCQYLSVDDYPTLPFSGMYSVGFVNNIIIARWEC